MDFYFLLFDKFETLDLFGPVEIFGRIPDARLNYISMKGGIITSAQGTQILTQNEGRNYYQRTGYSDFDAKSS